MCPTTLCLRHKGSGLIHAIARIIAVHAQRSLIRDGQQHLEMCLSAQIAKQSNLAGFDLGRVANVRAGLWLQAGARVSGRLGPRQQHLLIGRLLSSRSDEIGKVRQDGLRQRSEHVLFSPPVPTPHLSAPFPTYLIFNSYRTGI
jgi:hypothetical protein